MSLSQKHISVLNKAISEYSLHTKILVISEIYISIECATDPAAVIKEYLDNNVHIAINNSISSELILLQPVMKLIRLLMDNHFFCTYQFLRILQNVLRALIFFVRCDSVDGSQVEFFNIIAILKHLLKHFLPKSTRCQKKDMRATGICLLSLIDLVISHPKMRAPVKHLMVEIYFHQLNISGKFKCVSNNFEIIMKLSNVGDQFMDQFTIAYRQDRSDLWLFKILQVLFGLYESLVTQSKDCNIYSVKLFENAFCGRMEFILKRILGKGSRIRNSKIFKLYCAIINTVIWSPGLNHIFYYSVTKSFTDQRGDVIILVLCKPSKNTSKHLRYMSSLLLTALLKYSYNEAIDSHKIFKTILRSRLFLSITRLRAGDVLYNADILIVLYGSKFYKERLSDPHNARTIVRNLANIFTYKRSTFNDEDWWRFFTTFAHYSTLAAVSALEQAGVQKISETLFCRISIAFNKTEDIRYFIDKYALTFIKTYWSDSSLFNKLIVSYVTQAPKLTSYSTRTIIPTRNILPFLFSSDVNQIENTVKILRGQRLTKSDMKFIVDQCFAVSTNDENVIGAALNLIGKHVNSLTLDVATSFFQKSAVRLKEKQVTLDCYLCIMTTCAKLIGTQQNLGHEVEKINCKFKT